MTWEEYERQADAGEIPPFVGTATPDGDDTDVDYGIFLHSDGTRFVEARTTQDDVTLIELSEDEFNALTT